jgi:hypothetical protein
MTNVDSGSRQRMSTTWRWALLAPVLAVTLELGGCGSSDGSLPSAPTVDNRDPEVKEADDLMQSVAKKAKSGGGRAAQSTTRGRRSLGGAPDG